MVLAVELVGLLVVVGVGGDVHSGPGVEHLEPVTVGVGQEGRRDVVQVLDQGVIPGISIPLGLTGSLQTSRLDPLFANLECDNIDPLSGLLIEVECVEALAPDLGTQQGGQPQPGQARRLGGRHQAQVGHHRVH